MGPLFENTLAIKLNNLLESIKLLVAVLGKEKRLLVHQRINEFYYMEKITELSILCERISCNPENDSVFVTRIELEYDRVYSKWKEDLNWLHSLNRFETIL